MSNSADVMLAVIADFKTGTYTVTRQADGDRVDGRWVPGAETTLSVDGSVQPATEDDMKDLATGIEINDVRTMWTAVELRTAKRDPSGTTEGHGADRVDVPVAPGSTETRRYVVMKCGYYGILSNHYKVTLVKEDVV